MYCWGKGSGLIAVIRNLKNDKGWNIYVLSKSCFVQLQHTKRHEDEKSPTRSQCLCSVRHLRIIQENVVLCPAAAGLFMHLHVQICACAYYVQLCIYSKALWRLIKPFSNWSGQKLSVCAGVQHLYIYISHASEKKNYYSEFSPQFNSCCGCKTSEAVLRPS